MKWSIQKLLPTSLFSADEAAALIERKCKSVYVEKKFRVLQRKINVM